MKRRFLPSSRMWKTHSNKTLMLLVLMLKHLLRVLMKHRTRFLPRLDVEIVFCKEIDFAMLKLVRKINMSIQLEKWAQVTEFVVQKMKIQLKAVIKHLFHNSINNTLITKSNSPVLILHSSLHNNFKFVQALLKIAMVKTSMMRPTWIPQQKFMHQKTQNGWI
jgi:hypothetical protein